LGRVRVDPGQIEQVVMNLATNARDAMPSGGTLTLETRNVQLDETYVHAGNLMRPGEYVLLEVTDTGSGIPPEHLPHIFEPFYTSKEQGKGTGLGLATVYGIVKQSGGYIWVYSERNLGTTFKIYFPRVRSKADGEAGKTVLPAESEIRGSETLLVVEDEGAVRRAACDFLKRNGYHVLEAGSGKEALEVIRRHQGPVHMMVTDVVLPAMSGAQLADFLVAEHPEMKILFVSGYAEKIIAADGPLHVRAGFLQKPFSLRELAVKVRETLRDAKASARASAS
jgi:CheY-like chemotaxis protein